MEVGLVSFSGFDCLVSGVISFIRAIRRCFWIMKKGIVID